MSEYRLPLGADRSLTLHPAADGAGLVAELQLEGQIVATSEYPLAVQLFSAGEASWHRARYGEASVTDGALVASGEIAIGSCVVRFGDSFAADGESMRLSRRVEVIGAGEGHAFLTAFEWRLPGAGFDDEWFAPGIWYGRNKHVPTYAIGSAEQRARTDEIMFREDRLPLPLMMHYDEATHCAFSLLHLDGVPHTVLADDDDEPVIDGRLGFGGFRLGDRGESLGFCFPGTEGDGRYPPMWTLGVGNQQADSTVDPFVDKRATRDYLGWNRRYHPLQDGMRQEYNLEVSVEWAPSYLAAMRRCWRQAYAAYAPAATPVDLEAVRRASLDLLPRLVRRDEFGSGIPTWIDCFTGEPGKLQNNFGIGFVARNLEVAALLLDQGEGRPDLRALGLEIIEFWVNNSGHGLAHTEWSRPERRWVDGGMVGEESQLFLRDESEAHRTCLHAWRAEKERGNHHGHWLAWARSFGDWLRANQNPDGSFHRAYSFSGQPLHRGTADAAHVIPFLLDLAAISGDVGYEQVAFRAASYLWENYHRHGEFIGGTLDNPNCIDKEASVLALEAYLCLFERSGEACWLYAAELAAQVCETWIFCWNLPMPLDDPHGRFFSGESTTVGYGLITTGFSAFDMYLTRSVGEFRLLGRLTGDSHYNDIAQILLHNTKTTVQLGAEYDFAHPGLQIEHWSMGRGRGFGLNSGWLPWVTTSHLVGLNAHDEST